MRRLTNLTIAALVVFAAVSGVAVARPDDLVSPDARDSARQLSSPQIDLRSPDAPDSARQPASPQIDLRTPDARDATTRPVETYTAGHVPQPSPVVSAVPTSGFDWADAGIGAAGMLALVALASGTLMIASQRRRGRGFRPATH